MATRFQISGFKFGTLSAITSSADTDALGLLLSRPSYGFLDEVRNAEVKQILERAVLNGIPFPELDEESATHIEAAKILAHCKQDHFKTAIEGENLGALRELVKTMREKVNGDDFALLDFLTEGRALFGRHIEHTPQYYSYLLLDEVKRLRTLLKPYHPPKNKVSAPFDAEYMNRLTACGYGREVQNICRDFGFQEEDLDELDDIETGFSRWLYEIEVAGFDLWFYVT